MTDTANLGMPFIDGSQAQKHVTHNEALRILDAAIQIGVLDTALTAPPPTPVEGERHIVATGATGAWAGQAGAIATYEDATWRFLVPKLGWCVWSAADEVLFVYDGTEWRDLRDLPVSIDSVGHLGINATATSPNLLSVTSNAALFDAIAVADGGSGDARIQISKESSANTASVVFSDAFSGRAEFGLVGSDAFKLKVSSDGSTFVEALVVDQASGNLSLPRAMLLTGVLSPSQITSSQNDYAPPNFASANVMRISTDAARNITGLAGGAEGRTIHVINAGSNPAVLKDENASSTAANRFGFGADLTLAGKQGATLIYDGNAARWRQLGGPSASSGGGGATNSERQNALLCAIYQSKLFAEYRRLVNLFATGFKGASDALNGILTGSSSGYTTNPSSGYAGPVTGGGTTTSGTPTSTATSTAYTIVDRAAAIPNGAVVLSVGVYSNNAKTMTAKIAKRNSAGNFDIAVSQSFAHPGGGWADCTLSPAYTVPGSGNYYPGVWEPASTYDLTASSQPRAYVATTDVTGTGQTFTENTSSSFPLRFTTQASNIVLVTAMQTSDASVSNARVLIEYDNTDAPALNTDLTAEVTCDGGSHWTAATLSSATFYSQGGRGVAESADQACTPGTSFAARIKTLNSKNVPIYGVSVTVR